MARKIDAMYHYYGKAGSGICANCSHFISKFWDRQYYKCSVYGDSNSDATDWKKSYQACELIDKPFPENDIRIVELVVGDHNDGPIEGQVSIDELITQNAE